MNIGAVIVLDNEKILLNETVNRRKISLGKSLMVKLKQSGVAEIVLVTADNSSVLEKELKKLGITFIHMDNEAAKIEKLKTGLKYLGNNYDKILLLGNGLEYFGISLMGLLKNKSSEIVTTSMDNNQLEIALMSKKVIPHILSNNGYDILECINSIDMTREQVEVNRENQENQALRPEIKLRICKDLPFLGPGTKQLLELVNVTNSVSMACQHMGISYSKGWKMISLMEDELGLSVLTRQSGGEKGGKAELTQEGKEILKKYIYFEDDCKKAVNEIFKKYFSEGIDVKQWYCEVCGHVHKGDTPPRKCPICGADEDRFSRKHA